MVGTVAVPGELLMQKPENVQLIGVVPRLDVIEQYRWADVFLLPSLCEGSATVTYEAMMAGLPVVCSENTGSIIEGGVSGFIVPILDPVQVAQSLQLLARQPEMLTELSTAGMACADSVGLAAYRQRFFAAVEDLSQ